ncbi:glycine betaine ABC transporter substrate-binding protein [Aerococcus tenax]|nr:glycine betaine ABC transporter substrate-binding protein [Aerococcus tenax]RAV92563.1 glycine/betaine ABC transporter substrate-binding protein [Aerococcus tenax]
MFKKIALALLAVLGLLLTFGSEDSYKSSLFSGGGAGGERVTLAYVNWDSEVASTHLIGEVLRNEGFQVEMVPLDNAIMWSSIASGESDAMVSAWLPITHADQLEKYGDQIVHAGQSLDSARIGFVVPTYMDQVDSIEDLTTEAGQKITGIEPGAGTMQTSARVLEEYPNLSDWTLESSSSGAMTASLGQAYNNQEEIVVTGWNPHWIFAKYDLKYLDDPKGVFGEEESIHTFTRQGFQEDNPRAYQILANFHWTLEDMESVMLDIANGTDPSQAAQKWIEANPDKVSEWTAE